MSENSIPPKRRRPRLERTLAGVTLFLLLVGCLIVMRPFLSALMWAAILCFSLWPVHSRVVEWLRGRRTLAAAITTLSIALLLVVPFVIIGVNLADDARALAGVTRKWMDAGPPPPPAWLGKIPLVGGQAKSIWTEFADEAAKLFQQLQQTVDQRDPARTNAVTQAVSEPDRAPEPPPASPPSVGSSRLVQALGTLISSARSALVKAGLAVGRGILEVALSVFLAFFLLRDGRALADRLTASVGRIAGDRGRHLLVVAGNTVRGVVYGILGTALVQSVMAGVGFFIAGVPGAAVLSLLTFFLSIVPMGPPLIWIPATIWLFNQGSTGWGIFMAIWGLGISSVDNFVKPWLISQGSDMPFILIFFGVLGGALAFGFIGVFLGPTLLAVAYRLIEEWSRAASTTVPALVTAPTDSIPATDAITPGNQPS